MDDSRKRELKRAFKLREREQAHQKGVLDEAQLNELLDHLDRELGRSGCDHTLRVTSAWATERHLDLDISLSRWENSPAIATARCWRT